jgi:hypothetical protein
MKRILCYLQGTPDYNLLLRRSSGSTSGYVVFLGGIFVSWSAKRQTVVSHSSAEAEYCVIANGMAGVLGCDSSSTSSRPHRLGAPLSTMTTSVLCTSPPTPFSINAPNMWRLIFILSERRLPSAKSVSSMSRRHRSSLTSS